MLSKLVFIGEYRRKLARFPHPIERVGFEAGTMRQHLFHGLKAEGFDVVRMQARQVNAALSAMRNSEMDQQMIQ